MTGFRLDTEWPDKRLLAGYTVVGRQTSGMTYCDGMTDFGLDPVCPTQQTFGWIHHGLNRLLAVYTVARWQASDWIHCGWMTGF
jgi:hypothetical protein